MSEIAVIGAGAWGTGLSIVLGRKGSHRVRLWAHEPKVCQSISQRRVNDKFLAGCKIPDSVTVSNDLATVLDGPEIVISVMPSQHCRNLFVRMHPYLRGGVPIVSATKGLEEGTLLRMTEVIGHVLGNDARVAALSGPTFALEVARGDPTALTIAAQDAELTQLVQREFSSPSFRVYTNKDVI